MLLKRAARYFPFIEKASVRPACPMISSIWLWLKALSFPMPFNLRSPRTLAIYLGDRQRKGLRKDQTMDERMALERSTESAILYLTQLKEIFGSWALAMAAYNCGENRTKKSRNKRCQTTTGSICYRDREVCLSHRCHQNHHGESAPLRLLLPETNSTDPEIRTP